MEIISPIWLFFLVNAFSSGMLQAFAEDLSEHLESEGTSAEQIIVHVGSLLQDLRGVTSRLEGMMGGHGQLPWESQFVGKCLDDVSSLASQTSTIAADAKNVLSALETKISALQMEVGQLKVTQSEVKPFTVSVTSEGGCCEFEHKGPWFTINCTAVPFSMKRGLNVIAIERRSGQVVAQGSFDTHHPDAVHTSRMIQFLHNDVPDDSVVMVACFDACGRQCGHGSSCQDALFDLGATQTILNTRDSYALIGYKGSFYGGGVKPSWIQEGYYPYPGDHGRKGLQSRPVTLHATITMEPPGCT